MRSARRAAFPVVAATAVVVTALAADRPAGAAPSPAPAPAARASRAALEGIQASVEAAVARVSRPAGLLFGRPSRAYHLKGHGAVVVLAPRALPRIRRHVVRRPQDRAFEEVLLGLERSIDEVGDPTVRARLVETLAALREGRAPGGPRRPRERPARPPRDMFSLQEQAEAFRREAERAMEKAERDVMVRLRIPDDALPVVPPAPPLPPRGEAPPAPPAAPVPPAPRVVDEGAVPPAPPSPPAPRGWPFWFGEEGGDLPPDRVLSAVRGAIVSGLAGYRGDLGLLGADEFVVVAIDFLPGAPDRSGARTLVARARKGDLADHRGGRLTMDAFRARVEFDEY